MSEDGAGNFEVVQDQVFVVQTQVSVHGAICQNVHLVKSVSVVEDDLALLEEFLLEFVHESLEGVRAQVLKVDNVEELTLEPLLVFVLVLDQAVIELLLDVGEDVEQLVEVLLRDHADRRVVLGLDRGGALGASQECDLSEVLPWVQRAHKSLLPVLILDEALTLALGNNEKVIGGLSLLDLDLLRLTHHQLNLCYHIVFDVGVEGEDKVLLELLREDEPCNFFLE